jgi:serine phosphatase RsbU (regulator of sigma subunit)
MRPISLRTSLLLDLLVIVVALGAAIFGTAWFGARALLEEYAPLVVDQMISRTEERLEAFFTPVRRHVSEIAAWGESGQFELTDPDGFTRLLLPLLESAPEIGSLIVASESGQEIMLLRRGETWLRRETVPGRWDGKHRLCQLDPKGKVGSERLVELGYDPRERPWFHGALSRIAPDPALPEGPRSGALSWTEPYRFYTTKELGVTASLAFEAPGGERWIVAIDVELRRIDAMSKSISLDRGGRVIVLDQERRLLGYPHLSGAREQLLAPPTQLGSGWLRETVTRAVPATIGESAAPAEARFFSYGRESWLVRAVPFELSDTQRLWMLVAVPGSELFVQVRRFLWLVVLLTLLVLGIASWRVVVLTRRIGKPLERLAHNSEQISQGQLEDLPVSCPSPFLEIRRLADAHGRMRVALRELLTLEDELQLARRIQQASLPQEMPTMARWAVAAYSEPARETGGDLYDVIGLRRDAAGGLELSEGGHADRLVLFLADATGHGLGPALSVMQLRAMLRMSVRLNSGPEPFLGNVNAQLCSDLSEGRFVTAWFAGLNEEGDDLVAVSFGQAPILIWRAETGEIDERGADAMPLGIQRKLETPTPQALDMRKGDLCVVVTDGIHEASSPSGERYGMERLRALLAAHAAKGADEMLRCLRAEIAAFAGSEPPADDRTALLIERR